MKLDESSFDFRPEFVKLVFFFHLFEQEDTGIDSFTILFYLDTEQFKNLSLQNMIESAP